MNPDVANFFGTYTPRLDDKGRLFLPAKFRPRLEHGIVLTRGQENCIYGWTTEAFNAFTDRVRDTPFTNQAARNFTRMFFSGASSEVPDKQGRISVPPVLARMGPPRPRLHGRRGDGPHRDLGLGPLDRVLELHRKVRSRTCQRK